jgi:4-amino-4-deoxy-L-arabinose transferase-like glycosyltransferase
MKKHLIFAMVLGGILSVRLIVMAVSPLFEPSEARYAAISANMARTNDWFAPQFTYKGVYQTFAGKPPFVFQTAAVCGKIFGINECAVRIPSFVSFLLLLWIVYWTVRANAPRANAAMAVGICATSVALYSAAGFCMMDAALTCCVSGALLLYWRVTDIARTCCRLLVLLCIGTLLGLGMLVKGPVALALFGLPVLVDASLNRRWGHRLFLDGAVVAFIVSMISVPYFLLVELRQPGFLKYFLVNENILRFLIQEYGDKYGAGRETFRGMAVIWTWVVMLPWSVLLLFSIKRPVKWKWNAVKDTFPLLSAFVICLFWCLTSRVPVAYLLPTVPLLSAALAVKGEEIGIGRAYMQKLFPLAALIAVAVLTGTLAAVRITKPRKLPGASAPPKAKGNYYSFEFYNHPWGKGAPK